MEVSGWGCKGGGGGLGWRYSGWRCKEWGWVGVVQLSFWEGRGGQGETWR